MRRNTVVVVSLRLVLLWLLLLLLPLLYNINKTLSPSISPLHSPSTVSPSAPFPRTSHAFGPTEFLSSLVPIDRNVRRRPDSYWFNHPENKLSGRFHRRFIFFCINTRVQRSSYSLSVYRRLLWLYPFHSPIRRVTVSICRDRMVLVFERRKGRGFFGSLKLVKWCHAKEILCN